MALKEVLLDTSVLIEHFRSKDKRKTVLFRLAKEGWLFRVSALTQYEVLAGSTPAQLRYWSEMLERLVVLSFDDQTAWMAARVGAELRKQGSGIGMADLLIASTALAHDIPLATLNRKDFLRIKALRMVEV